MERYTMLSDWKNQCCQNDHTTQESMQCLSYYQWYFFEDQGRKQRGTKQPLDESEIGKWKSWLKTQHSKMKDHASTTITSWQIEKQWKLWQFIFLVSRSTEDGDCSHEIKRCLLFGRKAAINLDSILKSRDITLPTKVHLVKAMVFPVVVYGCESWTLKKA